MYVIEYFDVLSFQKALLLLAEIVAYVLIFNTNVLIYKIVCVSVDMKLGLCTFFLL